MTIARATCPVCSSPTQVVGRAVVAPFVAELVGLPVGTTEFVALARDNSGNVAASPTNFVNITAATSLAPTISSVVANPSSVAVSRPIQLTSNASDPDGTVTVQYFANGVAIGQTGNPNSSYLVNWTPTTSGIYSVYAVATDNAVNGTSKWRGAMAIRAVQISDRAPNTKAKPSANHGSQPATKW